MKVYILEEITVEGPALANSACLAYATLKGAQAAMQARFDELVARPCVDMIDDPTERRCAVSYYDDDTLITLTIHETDFKVEEA